MKTTKDTESVLNYMDAGFAAVEKYRGSDYTWYSYAKSQVEEISSVYGMSTVLMSALAAGASRSCAVEENFSRLFTFLETGDVYFCGDYLRSIVDRYNYGVEPICPVSSPKVYDFHKCLLNGDGDNTVMDRHAVSLVIGERVGKFNETTRQRSLRAYRNASKLTGIVGSRCQSLAWVGYRVEALGMDPLSPLHHRNAFADYCVADYIEHELRVLGR